MSADGPSPPIERSEDNPGSAPNAEHEDSAHHGVEAPPGTVRIELPPEFYAQTQPEEGFAALAEEKAPEEPAPEGRKERPPTPPAKPSEPPLLLNDVDLNHATQEELVDGLDLVGKQLAYQIVRDRENNGPFLDLHDLGRVPGLGPKTFEKLTGLAWREGAHANHEEVRRILGLSEEAKVRIKDVAGRFKEMPGFDGCIIAHEDGFVLAASWDNDAKERLGIFAPQFTKKLLPYVDELNLGPMDSLTIFIAERPITLVQCEELVIVAIHKRNRFSRRQVRLAQQIVSKLRVLIAGVYDPHMPA